MAKNDFVKQLRTDPKYKEALGRARTPAERKLVASLVESFVGSIGDVLGPAIARAQTDPVFAQQLARALSTGSATLDAESLLSSEPAVSGSTA